MIHMVNIAIGDSNYSNIPPALQMTGQLTGLLRQSHATSTSRALFAPQQSGSIFLPQQIQFRTTTVDPFFFLRQQLQFFFHLQIH